MFSVHLKLPLEVSKLHYIEEVLKLWPMGQVWAMEPLHLFHMPLHLATHGVGNLAVEEQWLLIHPPQLPNTKPHTAGCSWAITLPLHLDPD